MNRATTIAHQFVTSAPPVLEQGVLYVSIEFTTALHLCLCGCGREVVTPLRPSGWRVTFDGQSVSLAPSIGNWSFPCRSHYWIDHNTVRWSTNFTDERVSAVQKTDRRALQTEVAARNQLAQDRKWWVKAISKLTAFRGRRHTPSG